MKTTYRSRVQYGTRILMIVDMEMNSNRKSKPIRGVYRTTKVNLMMKVKMNKKTK